MVARKVASSAPPLTVGDVRSRLEAAQCAGRGASSGEGNGRRILLEDEAGFQEMRRRLLEFRRAFGSLGNVTESAYLRSALGKLAAKPELAREHSRALAAGGPAVVEEESGP